MLNSDHTRKAIRDFNREPMGVASTLLRCAAGLSIVACLAAIGAQSDFGRGGNAPAVQAQSPDASLAHSQSLYQGRVQRFSAAESTAVLMSSARANPPVVQPSASLVEAYRATLDAAE